MRIDHLLEASAPTISFEFLAPRSSEELVVVERTISRLAEQSPNWVSVTYRVSTGQETLDLVTRIKRQYHIESMAHLTCANTPDQTRKILNWMEREGVANILALRGDAPSGQVFIPADPSMAHGSDLVAFIRSSGYRFCIGAACSVGSPPAEIKHLALKVSKGANFLITQLFFDNQAYFDLIAQVHAAGIDIPIVPGLMPISSKKSLSHMVQMSGASVPTRLQELIDGASDDEEIKKIGITHCIEQCEELLSHKVPGLHFYTFNQARAATAILTHLKQSKLLSS